MANIFDYLHWRGDLSFQAAPFNPVDNIILSIISYYPFDGIVGPPADKGFVTLEAAIGKCLAALKKNPLLLNMHYIFKDDQEKLLLFLRRAERYRHLRLCAFINHVDEKRETQFAAVTFLPEAGFPAYISFRGTDNSLVGWKEDFNMIFRAAIPAQKAAVDYMETAATRFRGRFTVGGHSKGGNLAVYAAAFCNKRTGKRINRIYNNDGPGFNKKIINSDEYNAVLPLIDFYIPQDSIIGLLFEHGKAYKVVQSEAEGISLMQHNPFSWCVTHDDVFTLESVTIKSQFINKTLMEWLDSMEHERRQQFITAMYDLLNSTNAKSIPDLTADWLSNIQIIIKSLNTFDKQTRAMLSKTFASLFKIATNNLPRLLIKA
jgi:hypothetical protein